MYGTYVYSPDLLPPVVVAVFLAVLSLYGWSRRKVPGALPLAAGALCPMFWLVGLALESVAVAPATKITWHKFQAVLQVPTATAGACFALEYAQPRRLSCCSS
jgi:hypothetical protein